MKNGFSEHLLQHGIIIIVQELLSKKGRLEILSFAGGSGIFDILYGAHKSYVHEVIDKLRSNGIKVDIVREIDYFDKDKLPKEIINRIAEL